jgi:hypothetical protein
MAVKHARSAWVLGLVSLWKLIIFQALSLAHEYYNQSLCLRFATPFSSLWLIFFDPLSCNVSCCKFKVFLSLTWQSPELLVIIVLLSLTLLLEKQCTV